MFQNETKSHLLFIANYNTKKRQIKSVFFCIDFLNAESPLNIPFQKNHRSLAFSKNCMRFHGQIGGGAWRLPDFYFTVILFI